MTEPASSSIALLSGLAVAAGTAAGTMLPGLDPNALVGAVSGGALFVTSAHDLPLWRRLVYLVVSACAGYMAAPEIVRHTLIASTGVSAFLAGACAVTFTTQAIERAKSLDLSQLFNRGG